MFEMSVFSCWVITTVIPLNCHQQAAVIYNFVEIGEFRDAAELYHGSRVDLAAGFIQFYSPYQIIETAIEKYAGRKNLMLIEVDDFKLGDWLVLEPLKNGELFPCLYQSLAKEFIASGIGLFGDDNSRYWLLRDYIFENPDNYPRKK